MHFFSLLEQVDKKIEPERWPLIRLRLISIIPSNSKIMPFMLIINSQINFTSGLRKYFDFDVSVILSKILLGI